MMSWVVAAILVVPSPADTAWVEMVRRIGDETGVVFGRVAAVEVHDDGTTYVLDGFQKQLLAFSSDETADWSIGREGQGPGEFDSPVGLTWAPDGSLWVIDPGNQRATAVGRRGEIVGSYRIPSGFSLAPWPGRFDAQGRFYHYTEVAGSSYGYAMAVYDEALDRVDVVRAPVAPGEEEFFEGRTERGSHMRARVPFTPRFTWRLDSRGRFVSNWSAELRFQGPFGTTAGTQVENDIGPTVTEEDQRSAMEALSSFTRRGGRIQPERIPDRRPVLATFVLDDADRIWALRSASTESNRSFFEVFDPAGRHMGTVGVPAGVSARTPPVVRAGWLVGVELGPLGQQTVVLARLPEALR